MQRAEARVLGTDHLDKNLRRISIKGGGITVAGQAIQTACQLVGTIVLARLLSPAAYGIVGMVTVVTGFLAVFADMGLSQATIQRKEIAQREISALFWINVCVGLSLSVLTLLLAPAMASIYHEPKLTAVTFSLAPVFLIGSIGAQHGALLRRQMRFSAVVMCDLVGGVVGVAAAIVMAYSGAGYWAIVVQYLLVALIAAGMKLALSGWWPGKPVFNECVRSMTRFGAHLVAFDGFNYFARNADNFLIGWRWGAWDLGLYSKAYGLMMLPLRQINAPMGAVAIPMLSRLQDQPERYRSAYRSAADVLCLLTIPGIAYLIMTSDWVIRAALGPQWHQAEVIFRYLGLAAILQPLANTTGWLFVSQARTREYANWGYFSGVLATLSFAIGLPWGAVGVAKAYAVACLAVSSPILFHFIGRKGPVSTRKLYSILVMPLMASLCIAAGLGAFRAIFRSLDPKIALAVTFPMAMLILVAAYGITSSGRVVLTNCRTMLGSLFARAPGQRGLETIEPPASCA